MELDEVPLKRARVPRPWWAAVPCAAWAARYSRGAAVADLVAGVTLGLTLVPQSIAYAALADLPVQYGLYSSFVGTMVYVVLGTVKEVSIGPTSLMALLTLQTCHGLPIQYMVLLTFLSGCIVLAMGLLRLGFLVDLISPAVTSGFTSATAVIIVVSQLKGLLGLSFVAESLLENVRLIAAHAREVRVGDCALAAVCCTTLLLLRKVKDIPVSPKRRVLRRALWLVSISRNALVVAAAAAAAALTSVPDHPHPYFKLSGMVQGGLPAVSLPPFSAPGDNGTTVALGGMARRLGPGLLLLPVVMVLANIAIAKAFCKEGRVDATQEMVTLGLCNMLGSLVQAMPTCGAFTRSAVSHSSGVRTPLAGLYSGIITLLALAFLTRYFSYIPKASLSSVLICAVIFMVDTATVRRLWAAGRAARAELCVVALTFAVGALASVELALLCGALADLARLLRALMRPAVTRADHKTGASVVRGLSVLAYVNAEATCARLRASTGASHGASTGASHGASKHALALDCGRLALLDHTGAKVLKRTIDQLKEEGVTMILFNASEHMARKLEKLVGVEPAVVRAKSLQEAVEGAGAGAGAGAGGALALTSVSAGDDASERAQASDALLSGDTDNQGDQATV